MQSPPHCWSMKSSVSNLQHIGTASMEKSALSQPSTKSRAIQPGGESSDTVDELSLLLISIHFKLRFRFPKFIGWIVKIVPWNLTPFCPLAQWYSICQFSIHYTFQKPNLKLIMRTNGKNILAFFIRKSTAKKSHCK